MSIIKSVAHSDKSIEKYTPDTAVPLCSMELNTVAPFSSLFWFYCSQG